MSSSEAYVLLRTGRGRCIFTEPPWTHQRAKASIDMSVKVASMPYTSLAHSLSLPCTMLLGTATPTSSSPSRSSPRLPFPSIPVIFCPKPPTSRRVLGFKEGFPPSIPSFLHPKLVMSSLCFVLAKNCYPCRHSSSNEMLSDSPIMEHLYIILILPQSSTFSPLDPRSLPSEN